MPAEWFFKSPEHEITGPQELVQKYVDSARELTKPQRTRKELIQDLRDYREITRDELLLLDPKELIIATYKTESGEHHISFVPDLELNYNVPDENKLLQKKRFYAIPASTILISVSYLASIPKTTPEELKEFVVLEINKLLQEK